ncbi:MAG: thymidine phosphorylase family protein [Caulobacteraceae bacterium]
MTKPKQRHEVSSRAAGAVGASGLVKVKRLPLNTLRENVIVLSRACTVIKPERFAGTRKLSVKNGDKELIATLNIADAGGLLADDEVGLTEPAFRRLGIREGQSVRLSPARPPASLDAVRDKIQGQVLNAAQMNAIISDLSAYRYSDMEIAAFLISCANFLTTDELAFMTDAMVASGDRLTWPSKLIVDKHCIGGIPGNRTSIIIVPILVAHGLLVPKTSSRAITSPSGTADVMERLARVDFDPEGMRAVVERAGGCLVWGGHANLSPADDILISVERPLGVDTPEQMVASILSKKISAGSTHLLIDIPIGPTAKIRSLEQGHRLRKLFDFVGARFGLTIEITLTDGSQPIGRGIGPELEIRDVLAVLDRAANAPLDLRQKALRLAGQLLEFDPVLRGGQGETRARELLESGAARAALDRMIEAQGPQSHDRSLGSLVHEVAASRDGVVQSIDCHQISRIARLAGAPADAGAGLFLFKKVGDRVRKGEPLCRIHSCEASDFSFAVEQAGEDAGFFVSKEAP